MVEKWIIEEVPAEEFAKPGYYLPHRAGFSKSIPTPVRPIFDASAHGKGSPSINDCLVKGSNLFELIPTVMPKFREKRIGVSADIRKASCQILVRREDRDYLRFQRVILSAAHRIFDPIGFTYPATIGLKILLQECSKLKIGWDTQLPDEIIAVFHKWIQELPLVEVSIHRWITDEKTSPETWSLHTFYDASQSAYAAAVFLRATSSDGKCFHSASPSQSPSNASKENNNSQIGITRMLHWKSSCYLR